MGEVSRVPGVNQCPGPACEVTMPLRKRVAVDRRISRRREVDEAAVVPPKLGFTAATCEGSRLAVARPSCESARSWNRWLDLVLVHVLFCVE